MPRAAAAPTVAPRPALLVPALVVLAAALLPACTTADEQAAVREARVDGGSESVIAVRGVNVLAEPGDVVRVVNANRGPEGRRAAESTEAVSAQGDAAAGATIVHAFTAAPLEALPPLFVAAGGGVLPNAGVWGACRGGDADEAVGACPVPPIEGPTAWDGTTYWSTGAMLPTEARDVPLADDIPLGTHRLLCALHPDLFLDVVVTDDAGAPADPDAPPAPAALDEVLAAVLPATTRPDEVLIAPSTSDTALTTFHPVTIEVGVGESVTWTTTTRSPHDVVLGAEDRPDLQHSLPTDGVPDLPAGPWDGTGEIRSGFLSTDPSAPGGTSVTVTFAVPGTYTYHCRFHPTMTGTVVVG